MKSIRLSQPFLFSLVLIIIFCSNLEAQFHSIVTSTDYLATKDSIPIRFLLKKSILPASLISIGLIVNKSKWEIDTQRKLRDKVGNDFRNRLDDYFQYVPIPQMYLADVIGIKSRHHWFDQTKYLFLSNLITSGITHGLKRSTGKIRPNGSKYAFPSGHTSFAFTNAAVLFQEFKHASKPLAYSGFLFSTTTGIFRMLNNKHWFSDVLVGAGIGILVTEIIYYYRPFKSFNPFRSKNKISVYPRIQESNFGCYVVISL